MSVKRQSRPWVAVLLALSGLGAAGEDLHLIEAVKQGKTGAVALLVKQGANVNTQQPDGSTALHWAAYLDDVDTANVLIQVGARVNATNELGATPLWLAASQGSATMVQALLAAGADAQVALPEGETALMAAARTGSVPAVSALLSRGANVNATEKSRAQTALMWAVAQRHPQVVQLLLQRGADVHARSKIRNRMIKLSGNGGYSDTGIEEEAQGGYTPLLFSTRVGDAESAALLLAAGANVNDAAPSGTSALVIATHSGHPEVAAVLLDKGADPNASGAGYTALHAAVLRGDEATVKALLTHGADPNIPLTKPTPVRRRSIDWAMNQAWLGATPFWMAAKFSEITIMRLLVESGADPLRRNVTGMTPLMAAIAGTSDRLGDSPADGNYRPAPDPVKEDRDILEAAATLVDLGEDLNAASSAGDTALHGAAARRLVAVVQYLLDNGAKVDVKNKQGRSPLTLATMPIRGEDGESLAETDRRSAVKTSELLRQFGAAN
jgi:ankyrin repeat protein